MWRIDKCLKCHEPIGERQRERKGVHATPKALGKQCELCHTDHKGRNKDILGFASFGGDRSLRSQRADVVPARGQAPDHQVQ